MNNQNGFDNCLECSYLGEDKYKLCAKCFQFSQLAEALIWAVGFIQCNFKDHLTYPDFRNAKSLIDDKLDAGYFQSVLFQNELLQAENEKMREERDEWKSHVVRLSRERDRLIEAYDNLDIERDKMRNALTEIDRLLGKGAISSNPVAHSKYLSMAFEKSQSALLEVAQEKESNE